MIVGINYYYLQKGGLSMDVMFWAVAFVMFVIAEISTTQLVSIWLAAGALVSLLIAYFTDFSMLFQLTVFIVISVLSLLLSIPMLKKRMGKAVPHTNCELEIGKSATVIEEINTALGTGRVTLNGIDWCALPQISSQVIPKGSIVSVTAVQGAKLTVTPKEMASVN